MKKITLFCSAGMSTSMLVEKMKQEAAKQGKEYDISAYSLTELGEKGDDSDVILLGPQVRFALTKAKGKYPNIPVDIIDMRTYGMMDGKGVLAQAEKLMN